MSEIVCKEFLCTGTIVEDQSCVDDWGLPLPPDVSELCCNCLYFEPDCSEEDNCCVWEVRFEGAPRVLHVWSNRDGMCPKVNVRRVVECRLQVCGGPDDSFDYCWPDGCPFNILPPGTYRITVPRQHVYGVPEGESATVFMMLEPVGPMFLQSVIAANASGDCCGGTSARCGCS